MPLRDAPIQSIASGMNAEIRTQTCPLTLSASGGNFAAAAGLRGRSGADATASRSLQAIGKQLLWGIDGG